MSETETENQNNQTVEDQPRYYAELIEQILGEMESFFAEHLDNIFTQADDYLFKAAEDASSTAEQNGLFECMNAIRADKSQIQQGFIDELSHYLQPVADLEELPEKKQSKQNTTLGLIEQNEMDEMVTLTTISSKAAMDNSEAISHLIKRFNELGQYNDHIFHGEALEPKRLCDAMHESVSATDLIDGNKLVVYRFFNEGLIKDISQLYDALNQLMIDQGILPVIDYSGTIPQYDAGGDDYGDSVEPVEEPAIEQTPSAAPSAPLPPGARRAFGSGMSGYASAAPGMPAGAPPAPMPGGNAPAAGGAMPGPAMSGGRRAFGSGIQNFSQGQPAQGSAPGTGEAMPVDSSGPQYSAGVPVGQVRQSIENFVGGTPSEAQPAGASYYSHQQVMTALTDLQAPTDDLTQTPLVFDANQIKKAVLSSIGESEGGAVTKAVNQVSEKTIDFIKLIFDAIIDEESITDEIKTLLLSLQIPVIKAAMLDSEFFVDDQHPARQLLDKIAEAGVGVSEHTDPVYIEIEKVVRKLLGDYDEDVVAFTVALEELKELTEEIYRKARETEAESQKAVKMAHAKDIVLQEIRKITLGKELPLGIRTLVLKIWPSMMFNHYLKNGKANDEWVEMLMILQKIIESVQPIHSLGELEELGLSHHDIVDAARSKMEKCRRRKELVDQVLGDLENTYENLMENTEHLDESAEGGVATTDDMDDGELSLQASEAQQQPEPEEDVDYEQMARDRIAMLPEGVAPGAWFIVYNGEDKPVRRLKLAVILVQDATLVFVDHLGNVVIEKDAEVFSSEIEKGLSGIIMQHSVFDHALSSALETIER